VGKIVLKTIALAAAFCLLPSAAFAAGLGKLTVLSALGQPLRAEIEVVSLQPNEVDSLTARLASPDTFRQANIELNGALLQVRFAIETRAGAGAVVTMTSTQPMNEPFFDMLIELGWSSGRLVREYTFLLDPPEYNRGNAPAAPVQPTLPAAIQPPAEQRPVEAPRAVERAPEPRARVEERAAPAPAAAKAQSAGTYTVRRGDTLASIAERNKAEGVSLQQMLVALYRGNTDAFDGGNMNRLRTGRILNLPDRDAALSVAPADAGRLVSAQSAEYNKYRRQLGAVVADAPARPETGRQASGKIGAATAEKAPTPAEPAKDQLKLSKVDEAKSSGNAAASAAKDDLVAKEKALKEANERIALLEKNVAEMKRLAQLSSQTGAQLQQQSAKQAEPAAKDAGKPAAPEAVKAAPAEKAAPAVAAQPPAAVPPADASKAAPAPAPAVAAAPKPAPPKPVVAPPAPAPESSFVDELLDNPAAMGGAGGVVILLAGYAFYAVRKKRKAAVGVTDIGAVSAEANSVFGASGGANIDTSSSQFQSDFAPAEGEKADAEEIDPIAEADVYMAYGRDAQAEEILKEALGKNPERQPVRLKLMEIYANRKDVTSFTALANEMHAATGGQGAEWQKAAELGLSLDPSNTLYGGGGAESSAASSNTNTQILVNPEATLVMSAADLAAAQSTPAEAASEPAAPAPALDFDLDLGAEQSEVPTPAEASAPAAAEPVESAPAEAAPEIPTTLDFDLDLGDSTSTTAPAAGAPVAEAAAPAADEGFSIDFELPSSGDTAAAAEPAPSTDLPVIDSGTTPTLDFDLGSTGDTPAAPEAPAMDLSSITLDLGTTESATPPAQDAHWQEVATKLDLAKAYQEMGDKEGARELLNEVLKEGDAAQQTQAQSMLEAVG
jgi:pilus assembly protein FimV